jgi:hypothetical protein
VIALPPLSVGIAHDTVTALSPNAPMTAETARGAPAGVTAPDALEAEPDPALFVATTVNV